MRLLVFATVLCLMGTASAQIGAGTDLESAIDVDVGDTVAADVTVNATAEVPIDVNASVGHAEFSFSPPLFDRGDEERFRFRDAQGHLYREVQITIAWRDQYGHPLDLEEAPELQLVRDDHTRTLAPDHWQGHVAAFSVAYSDLIQGAHTDWWLRIHAPGHDAEVAGARAGTYSYYARESGTVSSDLAGTPVWIHDTDQDGEPDDRDNCPAIHNDQANMDGDLHGDACDDDIDGDGHSNDAEEAAGSDPRDRRSTPHDRDGDGHSNDAETVSGADPDDPSSTPFDQDADGYPTTQEDAAGSDPYDARSTPLDLDGDGYPNDQDNCPSSFNSDQRDQDGDGIGFVCDPNPADGPTGDQDGDGVQNQHDVCPLRIDDQSDLDGDGRGDACDSDQDGDGHGDWEDAWPRDPTEWADNDGDGLGDNADQDDDQDGLSDAAEASLGTDPLQADSDGDSLDDLSEVGSGSDPRDPFSPDYRATDVHASGKSDGSVAITWQAPLDARVRAYLVWAMEDHRLVGSVVPTGSTYTMIDTGYAGGDVMYAIQPVFHGEDESIDHDRLAHAYLLVEEVVAWEYQGTPGAAEATPDPAPVEGNRVQANREAPAAATLVLAAVLGLAAAAVRRRD